MRETKNSGIITLPQKVYENICVDFYKKQFELYEKVRKELYLEIKKDEEIIIDDSSAIVKRLLRLVQITSNPKLLDESYCGLSAKEKKLDELLQNIINNGEKCIDKIHQ